MAKLKKEDLLFFSNDNIRDFLNTKDKTTYKVSPVFGFINDGDVQTKYNRIERVENLLTEILLDRFKNGKMDSEFNFWKEGFNFFDGFIDSELVEKKFKETIVKKKFNNNEIVFFKINVVRAFEFMLTKAQLKL